MVLTALPEAFSSFLILLILASRFSAKGMVGCGQLKRSDRVELWRKLLALVIVAVGIIGMLTISQFVLKGSLF